jgi:phospholipase/lecithinase/hemolysin
VEKGQRSKLDGSRYREWNKKLREKLKEFTDSHTEASTFLFSSFETFNRVLDDPTSFGFDAKEATKGCGQIWWDDNIHPTTKLYKIIAEDIIDLLNDPPRSV